MSEGQIDPSVDKESEDIIPQEEGIEAARHPEEASVINLTTNPWGQAGPRLLHYKEMVSRRSPGGRNPEGFYKALDDSLRHVQRRNEMENRRGMGCTGVRNCPGPWIHKLAVCLRTGNLSKMCLRVCAKFDYHETMSCGVSFCLKFHEE